MHGRAVIYGIFVFSIDHADGLCFGGVVLSEYLLCVIGTVIVSAILTAILPEGKTSGLIKTITRLACILAIVSPVLRFFSVGELTFGGMENSKEIFSQSVIEGEEAFIEYYSEMRIRETERALEGELSEKYGLDTEVTLLCEKQTEQVDGKYPSNRIKIKEIRVKLKKLSNEEVLKKMWEYLTKNYCSEVLIE